MEVISTVSSVVATSVAGGPRVRPTGGLAANSLAANSPARNNGPAPAGSAGIGSAEITLLLTEDHDRIAHTLNDIVVRRLFAAGLDLQAALGLISDHLVAGKIERAVGELDLAIRDLRETVFGGLGTRSVPPAPGTAVPKLIPVIGADRRQHA
jgi:hypothetical protein